MASCAAGVERHELQLAQAAMHQAGELGGDLLASVTGKGAGLHHAQSAAGAVEPKIAIAVVIGRARHAAGDGVAPDLLTDHRNLSRLEHRNLDRVVPPLWVPLQGLSAGGRPSTAPSTPLVRQAGASGIVRTNSALDLVVLDQGTPVELTVTGCGLTARGNAVSGCAVRGVAAPAAREPQERADDKSVRAWSGGTHTSVKMQSSPAQRQEHADCHQYRPHQPRRCQRERQRAEQAEMVDRQRGHDLARDD